MPLFFRHFTQKRGGIDNLVFIHNEREECVLKDSDQDDEADRFSRVFHKLGIVPIIEDK